MHKTLGLSCSKLAAPFPMSLLLLQCRLNSLCLLTLSSHLSMTSYSLFKIVSIVAAEENTGNIVCLEIVIQQEITKSVLLLQKTSPPMFLLQIWNKDGVNKNCENDNQNSFKGRHVYTR